MKLLEGQSMVHWAESAAVNGFKACFKAKGLDVEWSQYHEAFRSAFIAEYDRCMPLFGDELARGVRWTLASEHFSRQMVVFGAMFAGKILAARATVERPVVQDSLVVGS